VAPRASRPAPARLPPSAPSARLPRLPLGSAPARSVRSLLPLSFTAVNHIGLFVAKAKGFFAEAGLGEVTLLSPHVDQYKTTPAQLVERGDALLAVCPSESIISSATRPASSPRPALRAVAALLQEDTSAIVALKSSGVARPADLNCKRYASYSARYEGRIVQALIRADGGAGEYAELTPPMLECWPMVLDGRADATWAFIPELVEAQRAGVELAEFRLADYGVAYGYSPVLAAAAAALEARGGDVRAALAAAARGYAFAAACPEEAADLLAAAVAAEYPDLPAPLEVEAARAGAKLAAPAMLDAAGRWGAMRAERWDAFLDWLSEAGLLTTKVQSRGAPGADAASLDALRAGDAGERFPRSAVDAAALFTNDFLPAV
jgi:ABC-type nitrate/sulfonate/bicarbonate transport system substrate-binding protein